VLRRRLGETIAIGGGIEIEVIEISRTRVKLGVKAPREVSVVRKETIAVAAENRKALEFIAGGPEAMTEHCVFWERLYFGPPSRISGSPADKYFRRYTGHPERIGRTWARHDDG
jgi:carbon storage regulator